MPRFTVKRAGLLKDFLAQSLGISATQAKKLLDAKKVFVNQQRVWIAGYKLKPGDAVETTADISASLNVHAAQRQLSRTAGGNRSVRYVVAAEDSEYIIVNKPAGLLVNAQANSLENLLQKDLKNPQIRAAHRLDRDTSGVVIFAKNAAAFAEIVKVFQKFGVEKYYRGIAQGDLLRKFSAKFTLNQPIDGQSAETRIRVLKTNALASYFEAQIITGRKHQIRAHLAQAGFPLLGENIYQTAALKNAVYRQAPRQMLHAAAVRFINPFSGKILQAAAPEPPDFQNTLRALKL
ncbi:23S rRNA pseudouridine synthase D [Candidatus Termititenax persephonae]|uniref:RNA pseudouridylate synthase n=1 Tax=Candidatus Termititenax persephonae TaxID=2218525 RepID=A0A388TFG5_9BACT|nr:23S rRNA pseudouridine synthase D [Candidatus Termititenax persephonae]